MGNGQGCITFKYCSCTCRTDLNCVVCQTYVCETCFELCCLCGEAVCFNCHRQDLCCEKPNGSTIRAMTRFYTGGLVDQNGFETLAYLCYSGQSRNQDYINLRKSVARKNVEVCVQSGIMPPVGKHGVKLFGECFPSITAKNEKKLMSYLKQHMTNNDESDLIAFVLMFSRERERILSYDGMDDFLQSNGAYHKCTIHAACDVEGLELFETLKDKHLLKFDALSKRTNQIKHLKALQWFEQCSGSVDVWKNQLNFDVGNVEILSHLLEHNFIDVELLVSNARKLEVEVLEFLLKQGKMSPEALSKIPLYKLSIDLETGMYLPHVFIFFLMWTVKLLNSVAYKFERDMLLKSSHLDACALYALVYCNVFSIADLRQDDRSAVIKHAVTRDVEFSANTLHLMKVVRKRKVRTFLLCLKRYNKRLPKDIVVMLVNLWFKPRKKQFRK